MSTTLQREGGLTVALSLAVNVLMAGAKLSVGFIASSQALVADGIHSLVDIASDIAAIIGRSSPISPRTTITPTAIIASPPWRRCSSRRWC